ncbi:MAG: DUF4340 domain-containing protein [Planctomycetes bacterium]|nr:DUF4340 domain-containing protein [Planctomycetota bacterium]
MKLKIGVAAAVLLLVIAQINYTVKDRRRVAIARAAAILAPPVRPNPSEAAEIILQGAAGDAVVHLVKGDDGWIIRSLYDSPAKGDKVERFLEQILKGEAKLAAPAGGAAFPAAGLGEGEGVTVRLRRLDGGDLPGMAIGLRPDGDYESTYVKAPGDARIFLLAGDLRGEIGLWRNASDAKPESSIWLERRIFSFTTDLAVNLDIICPDRRIRIVRGEGGDWRFLEIAPEKNWREGEVLEWLRKLAAFRVSGVVDPSLRSVSGLDNPTHRLVLTLADGKQQSLLFGPSGVGEGMLVESSERPGQVFFLSEWRFRFYFPPQAGFCPDTLPDSPSENTRPAGFYQGASEQLGEGTAKNGLPTE